MTDHYEFEIHLHGLDTEPGKIDLAHLGRLATALQELAVRLGRAMTSAPAVGRTKDDVKGQTRIVFAGTKEGSTVLSLEGPTLTEELDLSPAAPGLSVQVMEELPQVLTGETADRWAGFPLVLESALAFVEALDSADDVELRTKPPRAPARVVRLDQTAAMQRIGRASSPGVQADDSQVSVSGELYRVDAHSGHFRLQDDLGTAIEVWVRDDPAEAARLVTGRVKAEGVARRDAHGRITRLDDARVSVDEDRDPYGFFVRTDVEALLEAAIPFDPDDTGIPGVDDEEIDELLRSIGR